MRSKVRQTAMVMMFFAAIAIAQTPPSALSAEAAAARTPDFLVDDSVLQSPANACMEVSLSVHPVTIALGLVTAVNPLAAGLVAQIALSALAAQDIDYCIGGYRTCMARARLVNSACMRGCGYLPPCSVGCAAALVYETSSCFWRFQYCTE